MRVLQIKAVLDNGGVVKVMYNLATHMDMVTFDWLITKEIESVEWKEKFEQIGSLFHLLKRGKSKIILLREYYKFFKEHDYDIVQINTDTPSRWLVLAVAKFAGVKHRIVHSHSAQAGLRINRLKVIKNMIDKVFLGLFATDFIACSEYAAKWLFSEKYINKVNIVYNGIDCSQFTYSPIQRAEIRKREKINDTAVVIGTVGRLSQEKNQIFLIDVFIAFHEKYPNSYLWLVGDGDMREILIKKAQINKISDKVKFWGQTENVSQILQGMDAFMLTSLYEGFSLAAIEAQASGIMSYLSDTISKEHGITEKAVFLPIQEKNYIEWAERILKDVMEGKLDRSKENLNLENSRYDIVFVSSWFEKFYISMK